MTEALKMAQKAFEADEVPVGAIIVRKGQILAKAHNQVETLHDPTAHAEMIAITQAANALSQKWLQDCTMYVTIEPCSMCAGALVLSRIKRLVFAAKDPKTGACGSVVDVTRHPKLNHKIDVEGGLMEKECAMLISEFFARKRSASHTK
jgi:tRNA(adenine34) deaminase